VTTNRKVYKPKFAKENMTHGIIRLNEGKNLEGKVQPNGNLFGVPGPAGKWHPIESTTVPQAQSTGHEYDHIGHPISIEPVGNASNIDGGHYKAPTGSIPTTVPACPVIDQTDIPGNYHG